MYNEILNLTGDEGRVKDELFKKNFNVLVIRVADPENEVSSVSDMKDIIVNGVLRSDESIYLLEEISLEQIFLLSDYLGGYSFNADDEYYSALIPFGVVSLSEDISFEIRVKNDSGLSSDVQIKFVVAGNSMTSARLQKYRSVDGPGQRTFKDTLGIYSFDDFGGDIIVNYETSSDTVDYDIANSFALGSGDMQSLTDFGVVWEDQSYDDYGQSVSLDFPEGQFVAVSRVYDVRYHSRATRVINRENELVRDALRSTNDDARSIV